MRWWAFIVKGLRYWVRSTVQAIYKWGIKKFKVYSWPKIFREKWLWMMSTQWEILVLIGHPLFFNFFITYLQFVMLLVEFHCFRINGCLFNMQHIKTSLLHSSFSIYLDYFWPWPKGWQWHFWCTVVTAIFFVLKSLPITPGRWRELRILMRHQMAYKIHLVT